MQYVTDRFLSVFKDKGAKPLPPIWIMRQAGRYLPEYQRIRSKMGFMEMCRNPETIAEVTLMPVKVLGVDAAILFSDILLVPNAMGLRVVFEESKGPIIENPIREAKDVERLSNDREGDLSFVMDGVRLIKRASQTPLIGFAGAPFTVACYCLEGGHSKSFERMKSFMYHYPEAYQTFMSKLTDSTIRYLRSQIDAGVDAIQLFDTWAGILAPHEYARYVLPFTKRIFSSLPSHVPTIHYANTSSTLLTLIQETGAKAVSVDWRIRLKDAILLLGEAAIVQGNMDPTILLAPIDHIQKEAARILANGRSAHGHIFNLGHGILPMTPVDHVKALTDYVHLKNFTPQVEDLS